jgi:hypothetical protein
LHIHTLLCSGLEHRPGIPNPAYTTACLLIFICNASRPWRLFVVVTLEFSHAIMHVFGVTYTHVPLKLISLYLKLNLNLMNLSQLQQRTITYLQKQWQEKVTGNNSQLTTDPHKQTFDTVCSFRRVPNWRLDWPRYSFSQSPHCI